MKIKYLDLIEQTFDFPTNEFEVVDNELNFHEIPLMSRYRKPRDGSMLPWLKLITMVIILIATVPRVRISPLCCRKQ
jgi:hypothetical protein